MLYVVTGPEQSGKSARAEQLAVSLGKPVIYLATMIPCGEAGRQRINRHRRLREGKGFQLIECSRGVDQIEVAANTVVLLECLLNLAANELFEERRAECDPELVINQLMTQINKLAIQCQDLIVVTGEMVERQEYDEQTKTYIEVVNRVNQFLYQRADQIISVQKSDPPYFPLFVDLSGQKIVIVGAGMIAARRAAALTAFGPAILVIAPRGCDQIQILDQNGQIHWEQRRFAEADLQGAKLVLAATNDNKLNDQIAASCRRQKIPVNHAGDRSQCDFYFPGLARNGSVVVGVTASGRDHALAKTITKAAGSWLETLMEGRES